MTFPRKTRRKDHQKRPKQVYTVGHEQGKRTCFGDLSVLNSVMKYWKCRFKKALAPVVGEVSGDTFHIIVSSETAGIS